MSVFCRSRVLRRVLTLVHFSGPNWKAVGYRAGYRTSSFRLRIYVYIETFLSQKGPEIRTGLMKDDKDVRTYP